MSSGDEDPYTAPRGGFAPASPRYAELDTPPDYKTAGVLMTVSGILNVFSALMWFSMLIWFCVGVFWLVPLALGIFEIVAGLAAMQGRPQTHAKTASILGVVASVLNFNVLTIALEIVALVNLGKPEVEHFLDAR